MLGNLILSKIDQIVKKIIEYKDNQNFSDYIDKIKSNTKKVSDKSLNEIEINKCKIQLSKQYYLIGKYVVYQFHKENVSDFSYDEEFKKNIKEAAKLKSYIEKISS
tara:strand:- start:1099 stop:1416 length:318 start_codon:yes stop_codon:yes gene_type:complete